MGQLTQHTTYACPCGAGSVLLTSTRFGTGGARKVHTQVVRCPECAGKYRYAFVKGDDDTTCAEAEHIATGEKQTLTERAPAARPAP